MVHWQITTYIPRYIPSEKNDEAFSKYTTQVDSWLVCWLASHQVITNLFTFPKKKEPDVHNFFVLAALSKPSSPNLAYAVNSKNFYQPFK